MGPSGVDGPLWVEYYGGILKQSEAADAADEGDVVEGKEMDGCWRHAVLMLHRTTLGGWAPYKHTPTLIRGCFL